MFRSRCSAVQVCINSTTLTGPHDQKLECIPDTQQHQQVKPTRRTAADENRHDVPRREAWDGQQHRRHAPLQTAPSAELVQDDVGRHVVVQKVTSVDADDPDQAEHEHSPLLVTGDKEMRRTAPVEAHQVVHRIRRWLTQVEAAFRQQYPAPALPWKSPAPRGVRGSVRSPREHGSIDVPGTRFPTAPSEMIGPEQREQTMFTCSNWQLHDQRGHDGVCVLLAVHFMAGWEVER